MELVSLRLENVLEEGWGVGDVGSRGMGWGVNECGPGVGVMGWVGRR